MSAELTGFCNCDYHDGWHGCLAGNKEKMRRMSEVLRDAQVAITVAATAEADDMGQLLKVRDDIRAMGLR